MLQPIHDLRALTPAQREAALSESGVFILSIDHDARTVDVSLNELTEHNGEGLDDCYSDDCSDFEPEEPHEAPERFPFGLLSTASQVEANLTGQFIRQLSSTPEAEVDTPLSLALRRGYRVRVAQVWGQSSEAARRVADEQAARLALLAASSTAAPVAAERSWIERLLGR